jgi:hypothetical protein
MPLSKGKSKKAINKNIKELSHSTTKRGKQRSHDQNVAIAMKMAGKSKKK